MWNSSARIERNEDPEKKNDNPLYPWETKGNVTESGIFKFFMNLNGGEACLNHKKSLTDDLILETIPFSSSRKRASIVIWNKAA